MAAWPGLENQPPGTRDAITAQIRRLQDAGKDSVTILLLGKSGMEKSATINTLIGERVCPTNAFQDDTVEPVEVKRHCDGVEISVIDTPGLIDCGAVNHQALQMILEFLVGRTVDVLIYVDRLDVYTVDETDNLLVKAITRALGKKIWKSSLVALTRSQLAPSDGTSYEDFSERRMSALSNLIRSSAGLPGSQKVPVLRVENVATRCRANDSGDKILPDGSVWLPALFTAIADAALSPGEVEITERLAAGPDANQKFKVLIPLVLLAEVFLVVMPLHKAILQDKKDERRNRAKWEVEAEEHRRRSALARKS